MGMVIGIGEYAALGNKGDRIKTYALASCVALIAYSPLKKAGGMIHIALPYITDKELSKSRPGYFATTGVPLLINLLCCKFGCTKEELKIGIYGGADSINQQDVFNIGKRNIEAVKDVLSSLGLKIYKTEVGGNISRTIELDISTGCIEISTQPICI
jgi:chemotaxis protein CheD